MVGGRKFELYESPTREPWDSIAGRYSCVPRAERTSPAEIVPTNPEDVDFSAFAYGGPESAPVVGVDFSAFGYG